MGEHYRWEDRAIGRSDGGTDARHTGGMLDFDRVHGILEHPRRRLVLEVVAREESTTLRDLATRIVAVERGTTPAAVTGGQRRPVAVALHHVHLPKLVESGAVRISEEDERIHTGPNTDQVLSALRGLYDVLEEGTATSRPDRSE